MATTTLPQLKGTKKNRHHQEQKYSSRGYTLENGKYILPPPRLLKPYVDTTAGELDTWPAHASGQQTSGQAAFLSKNKSLVLYNEEDMGKTKIIPKPRFLDQLENFLKKEMRALGITEVHPNELRLQAHREVFEYLIEDFKTYKPLLSAVKNEYEMMLAYQRQQIRELEPLKQMLVTVSEQCDHKVMAIREEEKKDMVDLKQENQRLRFKIEDMRNAQIDLESQVSKLHEELQAEYHKYRDECDARKLLLSDINDLRYQQEDNLMSKQNMQEAEEVQEDPVTLKISLRKSREDERVATQKLNEMIANYGDVIPRRDFEALEAKYKTLEQSMQTSVNDFKRLKAEHDALLDLQKQITQQRDEFYLECETLRRTATPRPDWNKCSDHIGGGMERWQQLAEGKTSNELVDVLLSEIASGEVVDFDGAEYIEGQGTGPEIPKYLRYEGSVKNRKVGKRDCALLIKDIWKEKLVKDAERSDGTREGMADFLHSYLNKRFSVETMVVEWAYNLHDACQRYSHDENIGLFWGILTGEIDEEVYHNNLTIITTLLNSFMKVDTEKGSTETLSKDDFKTVLSEYFGDIDDDSLMILVQAAETELESKGSDELEYQNLFMEEDDGKTGPFLEEVRKFSKKLKLSYVDDIKEQLGDISPVSVEDLKRAVSMTDPEIDNVKMDRYLTWAFKTITENLYEIEPIEQSQIIERLQNGNVKRIGKKM